MLVYDGDKVMVPASMGTAKANQLQGTELEKLGEVACRICYDSLGTGRSSEELHKHILEVINLSVYEHCNFTVSVPYYEGFALACINRKGVFVTETDDAFEITANIRAILEWDKYTRRINSAYADDVRDTLRFFGHELAPQIVPYCDAQITDSSLKTKNLTEDQAWISLHLTGSRGWSKEQIRHRYPETDLGISQRSTRYVDESESDWVEHPLIRDYLAANTNSSFPNMITETKSRCQRLYSLLVAALEKYGTEQGLKGTDARKQAHGAARGYLGEALETEMIFSAPVSGWKNILSQRLSPFADAEIRELYERVLPVLRNCRYGDMFQ